jgi:hypothetical protein
MPSPRSVLRGTRATIHPLRSGNCVAGWMPLTVRRPLQKHRRSDCYLNNRRVRVAIMAWARLADRNLTDTQVCLVALLAEPHHAPRGIEWLVGTV